jgi:hypothetical protein
MDADGADGWALAFSGAEWLGVEVMLMMRVRARPSLPKPISMPILRRTGAARRSLPANARGPSGQFLDLATRSPTTSARAPRRSEAVPVHTVRTVRAAIIERTAAAIGSHGGQASLDAFADHQNVAQQAGPHRAASARAEHHLLRIDRCLAAAVASKEGPVDTERRVVRPARHQPDHRRPDAAGGMLQASMEAERRRRWDMQAARDQIGLG